jgi:hypothetical protein
MVGSCEQGKKMGFKKDSKFIGDLKDYQFLGDYTTRSLIIIKMHGPHA